MLNHFFHDPIPLGLAQAAITALLVMSVVFVARQRAIHIERETAIALLRAFVQIVAVGSVLILLLRGPQWTSVFVLLAIMVSAAATAKRRAGKVPGAFVVSLYSIGIGSGVVIFLMTWLGVIDPAITSLIPVGSMLVYRGMITTSLALDRFTSEIKAHTGEIEAGLSLGATSHNVSAPYVQSSTEASMIPMVDSLRSLGIVWIPGLMAGMILAGEDPIYAAVYQFVVMGMSFAVAGLSSVVATLMIRGRIFTSAEQLTLRRAEPND